MSGRELASEQPGFQDPVRAAVRMCLRKFPDASRDTPSVAGRVAQSGLEAAGLLAGSAIASKLPQLRTGTDDCRGLVRDGQGWRGENPDVRAFVVAGTESSVK